MYWEGGQKEQALGSEMHPSVTAKLFPLQQRDDILPAVCERQMLLVVVLNLPDILQEDRWGNATATAQS